MQSVSTQTAPTGESEVISVSTSAPAPVPTTEVPKKEIIYYTKAVQTEPYLDAGTSTDDDLERTQSPRSRKRLSRVEREQDEQIREQLRKEIEEEIKAAQNGSSAEAASTTQPRYPLRQLTQNELNAVTSSKEFESFIERSSKVIERALDEEYDLLADYTRTSTLNDDDDPYTGNTKKAFSLRESLQLYSDKHSRRRMITDLHFSPHFNELLLSSYTKNSSAPNEPAGMVLLWNTHAPSRPEYVFTAGSDVLSARFSPFHPNLVVGGCYSGQVCLWDTRISGRNGQPVQKTPQSGSHLGHTHPIYNISIVGTPNAHNILTSSLDGVVCSWSFDMLSQPQEYLELATPPPSKTDEIAPTSMSFPTSDPTFFMVGTEEGKIYPCHRYDRAGAKAGVDSRLAYEGHTAPVMSTHFHPAHGPVDLGDLMLSTSTDWSIKLWRVKPATTTSSSAAAVAAAASVSHAIGGTTTTTSTSTNEKTLPLLNIPTEDLVYDCKWSPHKPSVFAAVTGSGDLQVYDLNYDIEVPVTKISPTRGRNGTVPFKSLNRLAWEERRGAFIATGGLDGMVTLFEVGRGLRGAEGDVGIEEWKGVRKLVGRLEGGNGTAATTVNTTT